jgi:uncharacterized protein
VPRRTVLLDTSFAIALANKDDPHHQRAKILDRELWAADADLVLHWGVLLEIANAYARAGKRARGLDLLNRFEREEEYRWYPISELILQKALLLYRARSDKDWSLTDCISFVVMDEEEITEALTADVHFRQAGFTPLLLED